MEHAALVRWRAAPARSEGSGTRAHERRGGGPFWLVAYALAVSIMGNNAPSPIYPLFQQRFGLSTGELTVVFAAVVIGAVPSLLFLGPRSDRAGRRPLLLLATLLALAGAVLFALATGLGGLVLARVLQGLAFGALSGTAVAALTELEPRADHARAALVATVTIVASQAVGPLAAGLLAQYGPDPARLTFLILAALLVAATFAVAVIPETVDRRALAPASRVSLSIPTAVRGPFAVAALAVTASFGALGMVSALGAKFVSALLNVDNLALGGAVVFAMLGTSAGAQLLARSLPYRRQLVTGGGVLAAGLALVIVGVSTSSLAPFLLGVCVAGVGQGLAYLGAQELLDDVAPAEQRGAVMSLFFLVLYLAAALAALAVGLASGPLGLRTATVIVAAVLTATACGSALLSARRVRP